MKFRRILMAAAAATALLPGGLGIPKPARGASPPPALAGTTLFTASSVSKGLIRLERAATIFVSPTFDSPQVEIESQGRVAGVVLTPDLKQDPKDFAQVLSLLRLGGCWQPACAPESPYPPSEIVAAHGFSLLDRNESGSVYEIPAGTYRAYALTDGAPVRVTLRLAELAGSAEIGLTAPYGVKLQTVESSAVAGGITPYYSAGASSRIETGPALLLYSVGYQGQPHLRSEEGTCYYLDSDPPRGKYLPGCPGALHWSSFSFNATTVDTLYSYPYGLVTASMPGDWNVGRYRAQVAGESRFRLTQLWMDLGA